MRQFIEIPDALCVVVAILLTVVSCGNRGGEPINHEVIQGITMVSIPSGSFDMGYDFTTDSAQPGGINVYYTDEQPVHTVHLSAFQMSSTEITQEQFARIMDKNPSTFSGDDNLPVTNLGATEALLFCNKLSEAAGFDPCYDESTGKCDLSGNGFRLPTEAEWEYACRAGTATHFYTGSTEQ
ncbi:formylglycine-generating enzyme family protein, partial [Candidatus Omnitrophota bacterium]